MNGNGASIGQWPVFRCRWLRSGLDRTHLFVHVGPVAPGGRASLKVVPIAKRPALGPDQASLALSMTDVGKDARRRQNPRCRLRQRSDHNQPFSPKPAIQRIAVMLGRNTYAAAFVVTKLDKPRSSIGGLPSV